MTSIGLRDRSAMSPENKPHNIKKSNKFLSKFFNIKNIIITALLMFAYVLLMAINSLNAELEGKYKLTYNDRDKQIKELNIKKNNLEKEITQMDSIASEKRYYIDKVSEKIGYLESSKKCNKDIDVWSYLPESLKKKTYHENNPDDSINLYYPRELKWSTDCRFLPINIEAEGSSAPLSDEEVRAIYDQKSGLYIYDDQKKKTKYIFENINGFMDFNEYDSNFWIDSRYIFKVRVYNSKNDYEYIIRTYQYDIANGTTTLRSRRDF